MNGFEKRTEEKKGQILDAAFDLMNTDTRGSKVTMDEVATHAHVAKTTIFKYFGNKDNLIQEVFHRFINRMINIAREIMAKDQSFEETLIALSQSKIEQLNKINQHFYMSMMDYVTSKNDQGLSVIMERFNAESYGMMLDLFHRGRKEGKVDLKYSDQFLLLYFQAIVEGISNRMIYEEIKPYTAEWTEMLIKGVAPNKKE
ncbi:transcriptional regulator, TetR family [Amphibacillus marinus]|uniref:Transcriptional regulator, TetR family n=1 Tax=Amphibacillus marinus TaxID=872970 RepID=A0A1H8K4Y7_9BACI|nr:TetR/AcrR family transcriptional regulator [Amphibacillus marinus]SEN88023.1 transcriptional regulator, TetR family [Amphibacillus marinus]